MITPEKTQELMSYEKHELIAEVLDCFNKIDILNRIVKNQRSEISDLEWNLKSEKRQNTEELEKLKIQNDKMRDVFKSLITGIEFIISDKYPGYSIEDNTGYETYQDASQDNVILRSGESKDIPHDFRMLAKIYFMCEDGVNK